MKTLIATIAILASVQSHAFEVNLSEYSSMSVEKLLEMGADTVTCKGSQPRCILRGHAFGIQYPGQSLNDVTYTQTSSSSYAATRLKEIKDAGFCE